MRVAFGEFCDGREASGPSIDEVSKCIRDGIRGVSVETCSLLRANWLVVRMPAWMSREGRRFVVVIDHSRRFLRINPRMNRLGFLLGPLGPMFLQFIGYRRGLDSMLQLSTVLWQSFGDPDVTPVDAALYRSRRAILRPSAWYALGLMVLVAIPNICLCDPSEWHHVLAVCAILTPVLLFPFAVFIRCYSLSLFLEYEVFHPVEDPRSSVHNSPTDGQEARPMGNAEMRLRRDLKLAKEKARQSAERRRS